MAKKPKVSGRSTMTGSRLRRLFDSWPLLPWIAAVVIALLLYSRTTEFAGVKGVAEKTEETVAPVESGRLIEVLVAEGDIVKKGQVVARLDDSLIKARMAVEEALANETVDSISGFQQSMLQLDRQFRSAVTDARAALETERRSFASDTAELREIDKEVKRLNDLLQLKLVDASQLSLIKARQAALRASVEMYPESIKVLTAQLEEAELEAKQLRHWLKLGDDEDISTAILEKLEARTRIHQQQLDMLKQRQEQYVLRATIDGSVARVLQQPGDVVGPSVPVMSVVSPNVSHVVAFVPESRAGACVQGMKATIQRPGAEPVQAEVAALAPDIVWLPLRVSPIRTQQGIRGRRIRLVITEPGVPPDVFLPGETLDVFFKGGTSPITRLFRSLAPRTDAPQPRVPGEIPGSIE